MDDVCQQLVGLFRSKIPKYCLLVLEFVPALIWSYLSVINSSRSKVINSSIYIYRFIVTAAKLCNSMFALQAS